MQSGADIRHGMGEGDCLGLAIAARGRIADFPGPVVVDGAAANDRADRVAVGQGGVETLQRTTPAPLPKTVPAASASKVRQ